MRYAVLAVLVTWLAFQAVGAVVPPLSIPRDASQRYLSDGLFEGGKPVRANLEGLRFSKHQSHGFERWVFDFSDATTRTLGSVAPQFQIRYVKAEKLEMPEGGYTTVQPARIVINLKGVSKNQLSKPLLEKLAKKSDLVKEVISYPPIEDGDIAIEMILKDSYPFFTHQPIKNEGRLVVDLAKHS